MLESKCHDSKIALYVLSYHFLAFSEWFIGKMFGAY
jgi:hypothetical protein